MTDIDNLTPEELYGPEDDAPEQAAPPPAPQAPPEAGFSLNWAMFDANGGNVQVTMRAANAEDWPHIIVTRTDFIRKAMKGGWSFPGKPAPAPALVTQPATPAAAAIETGKAVPPPPAPEKPAGGPQADLSFAAETLTITVDSGKTYFKVKGGKFQKFGVNIWPEALAAAGFDAEALDPRQTYDLKGFTAHYVEKDGKASKVTSLAK